MSKIKSTYSREVWFQLKCFTFAALLSTMSMPRLSLIHDYGGKHIRVGLNECFQRSCKLFQRNALRKLIKGLV